MVPYIFKKYNGIYSIRDVSDPNQYLLPGSYADETTAQFATKFNWAQLHTVNEIVHEKGGSVIFYNDLCDYARDNGIVVELMRFKKFIEYASNHNDRQKVNQALNLFYVGDIHCNKIDDDGKFVAKYPEKVTKEFNDAVYNAHRCAQIELEFALYSDGSVKVVTS